MDDDLTRIDTLLRIMATLRSPDGGCPWDLEQTFATIAPYTIEEAYEVAEAIERGDMGELKDELGDLLFQVVFHAQMASEVGAFGFGDVVRAISEKMIRRHPHVFGNEDARTAGAVKGRWEDIKAEERAAKGKPAQASLLDDVPLALPARARRRFWTSSTRRCWSCRTRSPKAAITTGWRMSWATCFSSTQIWRVT